MQLMNTSKNNLIVENLVEAKTLWQRMKGLLGRSELSNDTGMWFDRCRSIHTCFMQFPIDIIFINENWVVVSTHENIHPWKIVTANSNSVGVIEFNGGKINSTNIQKGDKLHVVH